MSRVMGASRPVIAVIGWHTWELAKAGVPRRDITTVTTPAEAVDRAFAHCTR